MDGDHLYCTYILANRLGRATYIGVTNDLVHRVSEHREGVGSRFTAAHDIKRLVWYEVHSDVDQAIHREKRLKKWRRDWKIALIEKTNPNWVDLYPSIASAVDTGSPGQAG